MQKVTKNCSKYTELSSIMELGFKWVDWRRDQVGKFTGISVVCMLYYSYGFEELSFSMLSLMSKSTDKLTTMVIGLSQEKSTPLRQMGFWKFSREGGSKTLEIQAGGGLNLRKSSAGVISTDSSRDSNI